MSDFNNSKTLDEAVIILGKIESIYMLTKYVIEMVYNYLRWFSLRDVHCCDKMNDIKCVCALRLSLRTYILPLEYSTVL